MYCPHKQPAILLNLSQRDQQPWPGQTPRRWIRAWLSRWMKGCSQLTLQKRNRTTLSWQQTAGHRVSLISNGKCFAEKAMNTIILKNKCWPSLSWMWRWEKQRYFVIFIYVTPVPGLMWNFIRVGSKTRATKASVPSNISTGSGCAHLLRADDVENVTFIYFGALVLCNSCSPCIFNIQVGCSFSR